MENYKKQQEELDRLDRIRVQKREDELCDSLQTEEDLKEFLKNSITPHYTKLKKGDLWLMKSGRVGYLRGTEILGDRSFLFDVEGELILTYPGLPGCSDEPFVNYKYIQAFQKNNINKIEKELRDKTKNCCTNFMNAKFAKFNKNTN